MATFYTILTDVGQAKLANAVALGQTIVITDLAIGDGNGALPDPDTSRTNLVNETRRAPINRSEVDPDNPSWIVVEQVLPPDVGGWTIREIGVIDADGDLIGYGNYPETYKPLLSEGSSRTQTVRFVMEVSDTAAVTLKVDPSVVLATREYVNDQRAEHEASRIHPEATEEEKGMVLIATEAEARGLSSLTKVLTPKRLADAFAGGNQALSMNGYQILPSGLILQWGAHSMVATTETVSFPLTFPANVFAVIPVDYGAPNGHAWVSAGPSRNDFELSIEGGTSAVRWFALGI